MNNNSWYQSTYNRREANKQYRPYTPSCKEIFRHFEDSRNELKSITDSLTFTGKTTEQKGEALNYLWRSQIIMAYSAFDLYMHEVLYLGFYKMRDGKITKSKIYSNIISDSTAKNLREFKNVIKKNYKNKPLTSSFWGEALSCVGFDKEALSEKYLNSQGRTFNKGCAYNTIESDLTNNARRRNSLVHAYDYDNIPGGYQNQIDQKTADKFIDFITSIVSLVNDYINAEWN